MTRNTLQCVMSSVNRSGRAGYPAVDTLVATNLSPLSCACVSRSGFPRVDIAYYTPMRPRRSYPLAGVQRTRYWGSTRNAGRDIRPLSSWSDVPGWFRFKSNDHRDAPYCFRLRGDTYFADIAFAACRLVSGACNKQSLGPDSYAVLFCSAQYCPDLFHACRLPSPLASGIQVCPQLISGHQFLQGMQAVQMVASTRIASGISQIQLSCPLAQTSLCGCIWYRRAAAIWPSHSGPPTSIRMRQAVSIPSSSFDLLDALQTSLSSCRNLYGRNSFLHKLSLSQ